MKITKIELLDYQQFKDFVLDLTYPAGHPLAGQPLKKVCFIGQSGTGKTTILNFIQSVLPMHKFHKDKTKDYNPFEDNRNFKMALNFKETQSIKQYKVEIHKDFNIQVYGEQFIDKNTIIYFSTGLDRHINLLRGEIQNPEMPMVHTKADRDKILEEHQRKIQEIVNKFSEQIIITSLHDFDKPEFRIFLLKDWDKYDKFVLEKTQEFIEKASNNNAQKIFQEFQELKNQNPNPRKKLAQKLNPILEKFNLKINDEWVKGGLSLKNLQDEEIPLEGSSTGTKQILMTGLVLALLETENRIILFDEPENSLYPDVQRILIDFYTEIAPEAQFFFATHSPLIASQFEPCERFILYFDENGKVQFRNGTAPEGDDPNDILYKDYGMSKIAPEKGIKAFEDFVKLKEQIKEETDPQKKEELIRNYLKLQKDYNF